MPFLKFPLSGNFRTDQIYDGDMLGNKNGIDGLRTKVSSLASRDTGGNYRVEERNGIHVSSPASRDTGGNSEFLPEKLPLSFQAQLAGIQVETITGR